MSLLFSWQGEVDLERLYWAVPALLSELQALQSEKPNLYDRRIQLDSLQMTPFCCRIITNASDCLVCNLLFCLFVFRLTADHQSWMSQPPFPLSWQYSGCALHFKHRFIFNLTVTAWINKNPTTVSGRAWVAFPLLGTKQRDLWYDLAAVHLLCVLINGHTLHLIFSCSQTFCILALHVPKTAYSLGDTHWTAFVTVLRSMSGNLKVAEQCLRVVREEDFFPLVFSLFPRRRHNSPELRNESVENERQHRASKQLTQAHLNLRGNCWCCCNEVA